MSRELNDETLLASDFSNEPARPRSDRSMPTRLAMNFMIAIDTNIWIYSHDLRDPVRQRKAQEVIASATPLALVWQVGCEFVAASRKLAAHGFTTDQAWASLEDMQT